MIDVIDEHHPEVADNGKATRLLELLGQKERLRDPRERRSLFSEMKDEDYQRMAGYVNSVTRARSISYEYQNGALPMLDTPPAEDKETLMNATYQAVREILEDADLSDEVALRRAGLTFAGAINYIHPYDDGNGRTGRVVHYLIEYGTERGDELFNDEMYAIIAKLPMYEGDNIKALVDQVPPQLEGELDKLMPQELLSAAFHSGDMAAASARVLLFLDMMRGDIEVPIEKKVIIRKALIDNDMTASTYEPGEIDGRSLYEQMYMALSSIPQRVATDEVLTRKRAKPAKISANNGAFFGIPVDLV